MHGQLDDMAVIQLVLQGQQTAYATLVQRYEKYVFTLAMRYVNDRELAEELAQDVFVKAYRYLADFKGTSKFSTWLYTIVHTTCLSQMRKKKDERILPGDEKMIAIADSNLGEQPYEKMEQQAKKQLLDHALKQLPEEDARLITLYYLMEQSVEEIGAIMGLSASNVKVRLFRARGKMRELLHGVEIGIGN